MSAAGPHIMTATNIEGAKIGDVYTFEHLLGWSDEKIGWSRELGNKAFERIARREGLVLSEPVFEKVADPFKRGFFLVGRCRVEAFARGFT